jgi:hypothetical protein
MILTCLSNDRGILLPEERFYVLVHTKLTIMLRVIIFLNNVRPIERVWEVLIAMLYLLLIAIQGKCFVSALSSVLIHVNVHIFSFLRFFDSHLGLDAFVAGLPAPLVKKN